MSKGENKKGRENKKPKQTGSKGGKSDYQTRQSVVSASAPFKIKKG